jgi:uncharacterized protein (DUF1499 family)
MVWVLAITTGITILILSRVDDWGRDFNTNVAMTSEGSKLEPLKMTMSVQEAKDRLREIISQMSNWTWESDSQSSDGDVIVELVRTTTVFRFKDDVQVKISAADEKGVVIHAISRSRVGKGDLGQNPRNIRELFERLKTS